MTDDDTDPFDGTGFDSVDFERTVNSMDTVGSFGVSRRSLLKTSMLLGTGVIGTGIASDTVAAASDDYGYETTQGKSQPQYEKLPAEEQYVETRYEIDGTTETPSIFGEIIRPATSDGKPVTNIPVILTYSPYNDIRCPQGEACSIANDGTADFFVPRGYARATFDVVGTRNSDGCYDYGGHRERKTGAQLVEYLGEQEWSNGKVGMIGGSYDGTTQLAAAIEDPDHLAAIIPQVAIDRWYDYAFGDGIRYFLNNEYPTDEGFDTPLAFDFGFGLLPPANVDDPARFIDVVDDRFRPCDAIQHTERAYEYDPVYDEFWRERDYRRRAGNVSAAVFIEGGWLDNNVKHWDSTRFYQALPDDHPKKLVMGQWNHQASAFADAQAIRHAWFDYWLMGLDTGVMDLPRVDTEPNTNERVQYADWPPTNTDTVEWNLTRSFSDDDHELALQGTNVSAYTDADPPLTEEGMFATDGSGPRHLEFLSTPVETAVRIAGSPVLDLLVSSSMDSTQYTPVLFDEAPDGNREVITRGFLNARNRNGLDESQPVPTDEPYHAPVEFWDVDWLVRADHRVGLVVASDNRDWALNDPDGHSTNAVILGSPESNGGTVLELPVGPTTLDASGTRTDDGSAFTGGQTDRVQLTATANKPVILRDRVPTNWDVLETYGDVERVEQEDGVQYVYFDRDPADEIAVTYFVKAPEKPTDSDADTFGAFQATTTGNTGWTPVSGTADKNVVISESTNV